MTSPPDSRTGQLFGWGAGHTGLPGSGPADDQLTPRRVADLDRIVCIASGECTGYAIAADGKLLSWGWDAFNGLLGREINGYPPPAVPTPLRNLGHSVTSPVEGDGGVGPPEVVEGLPDVTSVVAASENAFALTRTGEVWSWGGEGALGRRRRSDSWAPLRIEGLSNISALAASPDGLFGLALDFDGTVWSWGCGWEGELGHGKPRRSQAPEPIPTLNGVTAIAAGDTSGWALLEDGSVRFWGHGEELGITRRGSYRIREPMLVDEFANATRLVAGRGGCAARLSDGRVFGIGMTLRAILGAPLDDDGPFRIEALEDMTDFSFGRHHGLAWNETGELFAFGHTEQGALGLGAIEQEVTLPTPVPGIGKIRSALAGNDFSLAITD